ncbi:MAG: hypothetical protein M3017_18250 [Actinomycetota bacterium]|nr:hypothetical protein [Actinomycetota bacterium]
MSNNPTEKIFGEDPRRPSGGRNPDAAAEESRPVRIGTVVWGLIVAVLGALIIIARQAPIQLDPAQVAIWLLLGAGFAMVIGGIASAATRRK